MTCRNKIFDQDGYCGLCGQKHQTRTLGRRQSPIMVNGKVFKKKRPHYRRIVNVNEARWSHSSSERCPRCQALLWEQIKRDEDGEEYVDKRKCRSCLWSS